MDKIDSFAPADILEAAAANLHFVLAGGFFILLLILIPVILRSVKKSKVRKIAPDFKLLSFQISPLGKDAWLRLRNDGHLAVLKDLQFKKRTNLIVKNAFRENKVGKGVTVSLFLQATTQDRIREDFAAEILYADAKGHLYRQTLKLDSKIMQAAKLL